MFSHSFREQIDGIKNDEKTKDDRAILFFNTIRVCRFYYVPTDILKRFFKWR